MSLNKGWTWISFNVVMSDMSTNTVFSGLTTLASDDAIKNQMVFTNYYSGYGFFGQLTTLTNGEMYATNFAAAATLTVTGTPVALPMTITMNPGWTWLPCPYQTAQPLRTGAPASSAVPYTNGDQFKSQNQFSEYYAGYGWYGTLTTIEPGSGYKAKTASGGARRFG